MKKEKNKTDNITYNLRGGVEIMRFNENGDIFVKGELVENGKDVVNAFREFLKASGHLK